MNGFYDTVGVYTLAATDTKPARYVAEDSLGRKNIDSRSAEHAFFGLIDKVGTEFHHVKRGGFGKYLFVFVVARD